jgi:hypothetical protein
VLVRLVLFVLIIVLVLMLGSGGNDAEKNIPSVQPSSAAMSCKIWNFLGSLRSNIKKCRKWLVTI